MKKNKKSQTLENLTLRDLFALVALHALLVTQDGYSVEEVYQLADVVLKEMSDDKVETDN